MIAARDVATGHRLGAGQLVVDCSGAWDHSPDVLELDINEPAHMEALVAYCLDHFPGPPPPEEGPPP